MERKIIQNTAPKSSTSGRYRDCTVSILLVGAADPAPIVDSLIAIATRMNDHPEMAYEVVVVADQLVFPTVLAVVAGDVTTVNRSGRNERDCARLARTSATGEHSLVISAGESLTDESARYLAAKCGVIPQTHRRSGGATEPLGARLADLGISLAGDFVGDASLVTIEGPTFLHLGATAHRPLHIGAFTYSWSRLGGSVSTVGRYCSIAADVTFGELEHPTTHLTTSVFSLDQGHDFARHMGRTGASHVRTPSADHRTAAPITVGNDVWIGSRAYIRSGTTLGDGCIIGTGAVVTKDVPPYSVVVGNPGRVVKQRFDDKTVDELLDLAWWQYDCADFVGLDMADVEAATAAIRHRVADGELRPYRGFQRSLGHLVQILES